MAIEETKISVMTMAQLKDFAADVARAVIAEKDYVPTPNKAGKRYVYGIRGISELFNVSIVTAQKYKNTFLAPAVSQRGRKVLTDVEKAWVLFNERKNA